MWFSDPLILFRLLPKEGIFLGQKETKADVDESIGSVRSMSWRAKESFPVPK